MIIIQISNSQITPIETDIDSKKTVYKTKLFANHNSTFENQPYELLTKLSEIELVDNVDISFVKSCINTNTYESISSDKSIFFIEYIINQNGGVISCSFINYGNRVSLTNSEIVCILTKAMDNTFGLNKVPYGVTNFYLKIKKRYKF